MLYTVLVLPYTWKDEQINAKALTNAITKLTSVTIRFHSMAEMSNPFHLCFCFLLNLYITEEVTFQKASLYNV